MKNIGKALLTIGCIAGLILMMGEELDGSCNTLWTFGWMALAVICGRGLMRAFPEIFKEESK